MNIDEWHTKYPQYRIQPVTIGGKDFVTVPEVFFMDRPAWDDLHTVEDYKFVCMFQPQAQAILQARGI